MKQKFTFKHISFLAMLFFFYSPVMSATYYTCIGTALALNATNNAPGTSLLWDVRQGASSISGYPSATAPTSFSAAGTYEVVLNSVTDANSGACASDPVTNTIIVLPPLGITLDAPSVAAYCEANGSVNSSDVASNITNTETDALNDNYLALNYTYTVTRNGAAVDVTTVGTVGSNGAFTLNTTVPGTYVITASVRYVQGSNTANSLLGDGCPVTSTNTQQVIVTPKPAAPTITIAAN
ncbi:hypothetical protein [Pedobacter deserti]|uniref:hypothetical protein n=1 Tax=Pedobacter deserti TaxID=2817382 RepID=UPI002108A087|nr:hypothetical protein [Pedobacter sp. SYSU D00382]